MVKVGIIATVAAPALAAYDPDLALTYAYVSTATMCSHPHLKDNHLLESWQCGPACEKVSGMTDVHGVMPDDASIDAFAIVGKLNGECTVAFRGTSSMSGWITDLKASKLADLNGNVTCSHKGSPCKVGEGFLTNYNTIGGYVKTNLTKIGCDKSSPIVVTGHSLGAAEAAIAMFDLKNEGWTIAKSYTFGQPRVGDPTFAAAFEATFGAAEPFRVTHANDPVPQLGFTKDGFQHASTEIYYKGTVSQGYKQCDSSGEDPTCADSRSSELVSTIISCGLNKATCPHLTYMMNEKTIRMDASSCAGYQAATLTIV